MRRLAAALAAGLLLVLPSAGPAGADTLVTALSHDRISIASNFTGTEVVVFGTIERDAQSASRPEGEEVVVQLAGPLTSMVTRRKERTWGIWINRESERIRHVPSFLAVRSGRPLSAVAPEAIRARLGLGLDMLPINAQTSLAPPARTDFEDAFLRLMQENGLYSQASGTVEFLSPQLFRVTIALPATVPVGIYTARVHLFSGGALLSSTEGELVIAKIGFEQVMTTYARNHGLTYGLGTVAVAAFTGWLATILFRRDRA